MARPSSATTVRSMRFEALDIPLRAPFGISKGEQVHAANVLVSVELEDGSIGLGEAAPFPAYNGETQAAALAQLGRIAPWLCGRDALAWKTLGPELRTLSDGPCGSALCAVETALVDGLCRSRKEALWRHLGGVGTELETDMTVTTGSAAEAAAAARSIRARGIRLIKIKVGGPGGADADTARIAAVHEAAPDSPLILDGNAALSRAEAAQLVAGLRSLGVVPQLLEQWLAREDLEGMRALAEETGWKVAADEAVGSAADARRLAQARAASVFNVKIMKAGITQALEVIAVARELGIGLMIGGNVESVLAMTTSACLAAGQGGFTYADLDTPLFMAHNPFDGGYRLEGGRVRVGHLDCGHGVAPKGPFALNAGRRCDWLA